MPSTKPTNRIVTLITRLKNAYPDATVALEHANPLQLLIATILSAQCTDARVNMVTPALFKRYKTAKDFANAVPAELEGLIRTTGFFRAKARNIIGCAKTLLENHDGKIPETMEELIQLRGVGRKTANVVLSAAFGKTEGITVDTHVQRLSGRLGLSKQATPEKIERDLMQIVPKKDWNVFPHLLILHGRAICNARKPKCLECPVRELCPSAEGFIELLYRHPQH